MAGLLRVFVPSGVLLLVSEVLLLVCAYVAALFLVLEVDPTVFLLHDGGLARVRVAAAGVILGLYWLGLYGGRWMFSRAALVLKIGQAFGFAFLVQALLSYVNRGWMLPRWAMISGSALGLAFLTGWRLFYDAVVARSICSQRVLFVGADPLIKEITAHLQHRPELGFTNLGYVADEHEPGTVLNGAKVLGSLSALTEIVGQVGPDRIVVGLSECPQGRLPQRLSDLRLAGVLVEEAAATYEAVCGRVSTKGLRPAELIFSGELGARPASTRPEQYYSLAFALLGTLLTLPVMAAVALAVKLTSRGPILLRQTRVGWHGRTFTLYKFRTMYADAGAQAGTACPMWDDPRLTPLGRWLRRLRLDTLPQLFNLLKGDMSMVGPRPACPEFVQVLAEQIPYYSQRHLVKPGLTGWAQIHGRSGEMIEDTVVELEYDLYYLKHLSLALDAYIMIQSVKTMLKLRGGQQEGPGARAGVRPGAA